LYIMIQLQYGLDAEGKMRHVSEVENGLACKCYCPSCHGQLVARQGDIVQPHFAHYNRTECSGAHESELHLLAKSIIAQTKQLKLPAFENVSKVTLFTFDDVEVEKRVDIDSLQPDLVGVKYVGEKCKPHRLWIEICVTHPVDFEKLCKIKEHALPCVEVRLERFLNEFADKSALTKFLLETAEDRTWLSNPRLESKVIKNKERRQWYAEKSSKEVIENFEITKKPNENCRIFPFTNCDFCPYHSIRNEIKQLIKERNLPAWLNAISKYRVSSFAHCLLSQQPNGVSWLELPNGDIRYLPISDEQYEFCQSVSQRFSGSISQRQIDLNLRIVSFLSNELP